MLQFNARISFMSKLKACFILLLILLGTFQAFAQVKDYINYSKGFSLDGFGGLGVGWFQNNIDPNFNRLTPELRLGGLGRISGKRFGTEFGMSVGYRPSTKIIAYERNNNPEYAFFVSYLQDGLNIKSVIVNPTISFFLNVTETLAIKTGVSHHVFIALEPKRSFLDNLNSSGCAFAMDYKIGERSRLTFSYFLPVSKTNLAYLVNSNKSGNLKYNTLSVSILKTLYTKTKK